jgi:DNA invertase Pin-like site-specific DNA recombinase
MASSSLTHHNTRVAIYARISTVIHGQDVSLQTSELQKFAQARGWQIVDCYVDEGISGTTEKRPELDRLLADAHQRKFDVLLCWKLDRLGRSLRHLVNLLAELESLGIAFISLRDNLDLTTPAGRLMFQVVGAMAEFEKSLIVERVKAGLRHARNKGTTLGRPKVIVDSRQIAVLRGQGRSWREIVEETGVSKGTAQRAVRDLPKSI